MAGVTLGNGALEKIRSVKVGNECERLGYKLIRYPLGENADLGFTVRRDKDIIIFTNSCSRLSREIFTLAHEIGHIILHIEKEKSFIDDKLTITGKSTNEKEQEANYFAACLLMPTEEVHRFVDLEIQESGKCGLTAMDIARMMSEFNVSFDMALNRLEALGLIDGSQKLCLDSEKVQRRVGKLLQCVGGICIFSDVSAARSPDYDPCIIRSGTGFGDQGMDRDK